MGAQSAAIDCILGQDPQVRIPCGSPPLATVLADAVFLEVDQHFPSVAHIAISPTALPGFFVQACGNSVLVVLGVIFSPVCGSSAFVSESCGFG